VVEEEKVHGWAAISLTKVDSMIGGARRWSPQSA